jgi:hypothetical protein
LWTERVLENITKGFSDADISLDADYDKSMPIERLPEGFDILYC